MTEPPLINSSCMYIHPCSIDTHTHTQTPPNTVCPRVEGYCRWHFKLFSVVICHRNAAFPTVINDVEFHWRHTVTLSRSAQCIYTLVYSTFRETRIPALVMKTHPSTTEKVYPGCIALLCAGKQQTASRETKFSSLLNCEIDFKLHVITT